MRLLSDAVGFLTDELPPVSPAERPIEATQVDLEEVFRVAGKYDVHFADPGAPGRSGVGQAEAERKCLGVRALTVAAAGHHNPDPSGIGPPGSTSESVSERASTMC